MCLDYSRTNEQIFIKKFVGRTWPKEEVTKKEKSRSYFGYKIIMNFQRSHLNAFLMTLAFYLTFLQKLIYMFGFYPTALNGCWGIVFTHGVRMVGRAGGWAGGGK